MAEGSTVAFDRLWDSAQAGEPTAQLALGRHYLAANDFGRARRWLARAGRGGEAGGDRELALMLLQGLGTAPDPAAAREHLLRAREAGDGAARYELALLDYRDGRRPPPECLEELGLAARTGHAPAQRQVALLVAREQPRYCRQILELAASGGDAIAAGLLARALRDAREDAPEETEESSTETRDTAKQAIQYWADRAVAAGTYCRTVLPPVGRTDGDVPPPSEAEVDAGWIPTPAATDERIRIPSSTPLGDHRLRIFDQMLTPLECEYLMEIAAPHLRPSHTVHPQTGEAVRNEMRTSDGYSLHPLQEDFVILGLKRRLAAQTGLPVSHAEPFALLRYRGGQEYQPHYDFIDPASGEAGREISRRGQREITIFSYLTSTEGGGQTAFPRHELAVDCRQGRALLFRNTTEDGAIDRDSLHASLPVEAGEKWIATLWLRSRPFSP